MRLVIYFQFKAKVWGKQKNMSMLTFTAHIFSNYNNQMNYNNQFEL